VEILLWLVPSLVVLVVAMAWTTWLGRDTRGEVDREVAIERLARALAKDHPGTRSSQRRPGGSDAARRTHDRSTGIAVRPTRRDPGAGGPTRTAS
jgi:hypothetical protein